MTTVSVPRKVMRALRREVLLNAYRYLRRVQQGGPGAEEAARSLQRCLDALGYEPGPVTDEWKEPAEGGKERR